MKERKKPMSAVEVSRLMMAREVFHECMKEQEVCVVLPDGVSEEQVFGNYLPAVRQRMRRRNVSVTTLAGLTDDHMQSNIKLVDLSGISVTLSIES
ncbi:hypothetical protein Hena1_00880 [Erwinia phage Hena1]|uniref:Uncharacterized protein n=1 Tax=Erwinia phage Hena1 TaxID=2678601 RepID=A0A6B9J873_9CAUD|nr:hypothetical protein HWC84_gp087 [Erwinia phage Hena1]QGZ16264.1 hypothetical protein Hena1_00880 [Erwinia phage Hena1]